MGFKVLLDEVNQQEWQRYAEKFADYSIYQTWPYQQIRASMDGQQISNVVVFDETGNIVTMAQVRIKKIKSLGLKIGYVQRGPLVRRKNDDRVRCLADALRLVKDSYFQSGVNVLRVVPNVYKGQQSSLFQEALQKAGFKRTSSVEPYRTFLVDVSDNEEGIRKRLRKSFRRDLRKAEKNSFAIEIGEEKGYFEILREFYEQTKKRKEFEGPELEEFLFPQRQLLDAEKASIIVINLKNEPVSAILTSHLGDTGIVLLAGTSEKGLATGATYVMWYQAAMASFNAGTKYCDLGGVDPNKNPGVYKFKSRLGGKEAYHIGAYDAVRSRSAGLIWNTGWKLRSLVKK